MVKGLFWERQKNNWRCKLPGNCLHFQASTLGFILHCLKLWRIQCTCRTRLLCICFFSIARRQHDIIMITEQGLPEESVIFRSRVNDIKVTINSPNAECFYLLLPKYLLFRIGGMLLNMGVFPRGWLGTPFPISLVS